MGTQFASQESSHKDITSLLNRNRRLQKTRTETNLWAISMTEEPTNSLSIPASSDSNIYYLLSPCNLKNMGDMGEQ